MIPYLKGLPMIAAAAVAGLTAVVAFPLPNKLWIMAAAAAGIAAGFAVEEILETLKKKRGDAA
jgi:hypothetical protein